MLGRKVMVAPKNAPSDTDLWTIDAARSDLGHTGRQIAVVDATAWEAWEVDVRSSCVLTLITFTNA